MSGKEKRKKKAELPDIFYEDLTCETCKRLYSTAAESVEIVEEAVKRVHHYKCKVRALKQRLAEVELQVSKAAGMAKKLAGEEEGAEEEEDDD